MTREEAKKILEAYIACESKKAHFKCDDYNCDDNCPLLYEMGTVGEHNEAINMAIQALEQEPSGDCISRQQAKAYLYDRINRLDDDELYDIFSKIIDDMVNELPSVKSQEPCNVPDTNVGDIISKQTVLDTISELNAISFYEAQEDSKECYYEIRQAIKDLSPVKQEPKTVIYSGDGYTDGEMVYDMAECPNCGYEYDYGDKDWGLAFCPSCGQALKWESEDKE